MKVSTKHQVATLVIGAVAALLAVLIGLFTTEPKLLGSSITPLSWSVAFVCTVPIIITLIANQISLLLKTSDDRDETVKAIHNLIPDSTVISSFSNSSAAMEYLTKNIGICKKFYNTRLARPQIEAADTLNSRMITEFDISVQRALKSGMDYYWIVSSDYVADATSFMNKRRDFVQKKFSPGSYESWVLPQTEIPFFHFCIIQYEHGQELLIGWTITSVGDYGERVFLIREERLVEYFKDLFHMYASHARRIY